MKKDFRQGGSAAEGAASGKRVYKAKSMNGFRPASARNGRDFTPRSRKDGDDQERPFRSRRPFADKEGRSFGRNFQSDRNEGRPFRERSQERPFRERNTERPYGERRSDAGSRQEYGSRRPSGAGFRDSRSRQGSQERPYRSRRQDWGERINRGERTVRFGRQEQEFAPKVQPVLNDSGEIRLNKFISNSGICSRREADEYIKAGLVSVNGTVITELGVKVKPEDDVRFNGERLKGEKKVYIVMNKPKDFVTTTSDPHAEKTVMELLKGCKERIFPVGRLDKSTTGVLMFTNDGKLAEMLTHPSYNKKKIYQVTLDKKLTSADFEKILSGIWLPDGEIAADALSYIENDHTTVGIEIHSGRNRIVRRIFESLGYKVKKLDRVYFAGLTKKNLRRGEWRYLNEMEINMLMMGSYE